MAQPQWFLQYVYCHSVGRGQYNLSYDWYFIDYMAFNKRLRSHNQTREDISCWTKKYYFYHSEIIRLTLNWETLSVGYF